MGDTEVKYLAFHAVTGEQLGGASSFEMLGCLFTSLFFDDNIAPSEIRVERV